MSNQQFQSQLTEDLARLRQLLSHALPKDLPHNTKNPDLIRILDLACGNCHEAETLADHFAPHTPAQPSAPAMVELVGVDVREREIADATARCSDYLKNLARSQGNNHAKKRAFEFLAADATKVASHRELSDPFDVVFLRHQNFWHDKEIWHEIFQQGLEKLNPGGTLILTSYFDREHALALEAVQHLGGDLITTMENSEARALKTPGKSIDKQLAVFRKPA
ncbi:MAG: class I SAM-dependent methyltransferase [Verrucomicrobiota bacterium]